MERNVLPSAALAPAPGGRLLRRPPSLRRPVSVGAAVAVLALSVCALLAALSPRGLLPGYLVPAGISRGLAAWEPKEGPSPGPFRRIYFGDGMDESMLRMYFPEYASHPSRLSFMSAKRDRLVAPEPTADDLLVSTAARADPQVGPGGYWPRYGGRVLNFPGKMVFFTNEACDTQGFPRPLNYTLEDACAVEGDPRGCDNLQGVRASEVTIHEEPGRRFNYLPPSDRAFVVGPHPDSDRSVQAAVVLLHTEQYWSPVDAVEKNRWIWDEERRPRGTAERFAVYMASHCVRFRDEAVKRIAQLGEVHVTERWLAECAPRVPDPEGPAPNLAVQPDHTAHGMWGRNHEIMSNYKFVVAMENTYRNGYVTEKLHNAFHSGAVPIYYGGRDFALSIFNEDAMVFYDVEAPEPALGRIRFLLEHPDEYDKVRGAPILRDGNRTIEEYFSVHDGVGGGKLRNRIRRMLGMEDWPPLVEEAEKRVYE